MNKNESIFNGLMKPVKPIHLWPFPIPAKYPNVRRTKYAQLFKCFVLQTKEFYQKLCTFKINNGQKKWCFHPSKKTHEKRVKKNQTIVRAEASHHHLTEIQLMNIEPRNITK